MREATGNALLTMIVGATIGIIMVFFVGTLSYSKSYKIKNYIIQQIDNNKGWTPTLEKSIDAYLKDVGYNVKDKLNCNKYLPNNCKYINTSSSYNYCVYECPSGSYRHYTVLTFMKFEFPIIGDSLKLSVRGSTKDFYVKNGVITNYFNK